METRPQGKAAATAGRGARRALSALAIIVLALAALFVGLPRDSEVQAQAAYRYTGVASCAGSTCHGRSEGNGAVVRQDEIATWQAPGSVSGAHSRAHAVLTSFRGQQIARSLGQRRQPRRVHRLPRQYRRPGRSRPAFPAERWRGLRKLPRPGHRLDRHPL
jgi:hypothetical protein